MHLGSWSQWMLKVKGVEYIEFVGIMLRHVEPSLQWCFFLDRGTRRKIDIDGRWWKSSLGFTDFWKVKEVNDHNHHITTSPHHYITSSPHHLITTSLHDITTSLHHHITTPHQYSELVICKAVIGDRSGIASSRWRRWGWNRTKPYVFSHKVAPDVDVGNLVCATCPVFARLALERSPLSALCGADHLRFGTQ